MSEINNSNPNRKPKLTRRGRAVVGLAGFTAVSALGLGLNGMLDTPNRDNTAVQQIDESPKFFADQDTDEYVVGPGEGPLEVVQNFYGIDAEEGENQVVQNNPTFEAEYQAVLDQNNGSELLPVGKELHLPVAFYTEDQLPLDQQRR